MSRQPAASERHWNNAALLKALGHPAALNVGDVGCGAGARCRLWAAQGHQVYGADLRADVIARARRHAHEQALGMLLDVAAPGALPWPDRSMDVCVVCEVLDRTPEWRACIAEAMRVLRPGGALYVDSADCPSIDRMLRRELARHGARGIDGAQLAMPGVLSAPLRWLARAARPATVLLAFKPAA
jgi:ubiquinone/menaquinone biosynthesis C-methylase UbiE